jgi:predicted ArsR family transcriptional regulator
MGRRPLCWKSDTRRAGREEILAMLRRRPCSVEDIAAGLGMHRNEVIKYIEELIAENLLDQSLIADKLYYYYKVAKEMAI